MMKSRTLLIAAALVALTPMGVRTTHAADADDTERNVRDRNDATLTPMDQGGSEADRTITQNIRKTIVGNDDMSVNAKNVKIITVNGVVTLRGPVKTAAEKTSIASLAQKTAGVKRVDDQLEVEHNK
jgi:osmotically-inducible protein OsmY